ncbi:hypothetical protein GYMLUDRAFT_58479 [Collybiopsis luxurians FD-317 M1]|uniref:Uncharacterized protein n=1 Tax=Collybiopsis luxurians FD-317 M1 TaxID=944289 RepID=A0A0D0C2I7_9AGAR|nr:hypothetical protein GYMLUDRAFT_58479 [Collybiopsis luxurians FD-317 M1]
MLNSQFMDKLYHDLKRAYLTLKKASKEKKIKKSKKVAKVKKLIRDKWRIPKPEGTIGRGGLKLQDVMGLGSNPERYYRIINLSHHIIGRKLDFATKFSAHTEEKIALAICALSSEIEFLQRFKDNWAACKIIKACFANNSPRLQKLYKIERAASQMDAQQIPKADHSCQAPGESDSTSEEESDISTEAGKSIPGARKSSIQKLSRSESEEDTSSSDEKTTPRRESNDSRKKRMARLHNLTDRKGMKDKENTWNTEERGVKDLVVLRKKDGKDTGALVKNGKETGMLSKKKVNEIGVPCKKKGQETGTLSEKTVKEKSRVLHEKKEKETEVLYERKGKATGMPCAVKGKETHSKEEKENHQLQHKQEKLIKRLYKKKEKQISRSCDLEEEKSTPQEHKMPRSSKLRIETQKFNADNKHNSQHSKATRGADTISAKKQSDKVQLQSCDQVKVKGPKKVEQRKKALKNIVYSDSALSSEDADIIEVMNDFL